MFLYVIKKDNIPVYIGKTIRSLNERFYEHSKVNKWTHNHIMTRAMKKYGKDAFVITPLMITDNQDYLADMEIAAIKSFGTHKSQGGYNITEGGEGIRGLRHSEESKEKMRKAHTGMQFSEEHRKNLSLSLRGEKNGRYGKPVSKETRQKISRANRGNKWSEESKAAMSLARKGKSKSPETRAKMREAAKNRWGKTRVKEAKELHT